MIRLSSVIGTPEMRATGGYVLEVLTGPFERSIATARDLGYDGVEVLVCNPDTIDGERLAHILAENAMSLAMVNSGRMTMDEGIHLFHPDPRVATEARRRMTALLQLAGRFGAPVNIGIVRGVESPRATFAENMEVAAPIFRGLAEEAHRSGSRLLLEASGRRDVRWINGTVEGLACVAAVDHPGFALMHDFYNMAQENEDLAAAIRLAAGQAFHVHCSDSNHWPPGHPEGGGTVDFASAIHALKEVAFHGFLTVGLIPAGDQMAGARKTAAYLRSLIGS